MARTNSFILVGLFCLFALCYGEIDVNELKRSAHKCCTTACSSSELQHLRDLNFLYKGKPDTDREVTSLVDDVLGGFRCGNKDKRDARFTTFADAARASVVTPVTPFKANYNDTFSFTCPSSVDSSTTDFFTCQTIIQDSAGIQSIDVFSLPGLNATGDFALPNGTTYYVLQTIFNISKALTGNYSIVSSYKTFYNTSYQVATIFVLGTNFPPTTPPTPPPTNNTNSISIVCPTSWNSTSAFECTTTVYDPIGIISINVSSYPYTNGYGRFFWIGSNVTNAQVVSTFYPNAAASSYYYINALYISNAGFSYTTYATVFVNIPTPPPSNVTGLISIVCPTYANSSGFECDTYVYDPNGIRVINVTSFPYMYSYGNSAQYSYFVNETQLRTFFYPGTSPNYTIYAYYVSNTGLGYSAYTTVQLITPPTPPPTNTSNGTITLVCPQFVDPSVGSFQCAVNVSDPTGIFSVNVTTYPYLDGYAQYVQFSYFVDFTELLPTFYFGTTPNSVYTVYAFYISNFGVYYSTQTTVQISSTPTPPPPPSNYTGSITLNCPRFIDTSYATFMCNTTVLDQTGISIVNVTYFPYTSVYGGSVEYNYYVNISQLQTTFVTSFGTTNYTVYAFYYSRAGVAYSTYATVQVVNTPTPPPRNYGQISVVCPRFVNFSSEFECNTYVYDPAGINFVNVTSAPSMSGYGNFAQFYNFTTYAQLQTVFLSNTYSLNYTIYAFYYSNTGVFHSNYTVVQVRSLPPPSNNTGSISLVCPSYVYGSSFECEAYVSDPSGIRWVNMTSYPYMTAYGNSAVYYNFTTFAQLQADFYPGYSANYTILATYSANSGIFYTTSQIVQVVTNPTPPPSNSSAFSLLYFSAPSTVYANQGYNSTLLFNVTAYVYSQNPLDYVYVNYENAFSGYAYLYPPSTYSYFNVTISNNQPIVNGTYCPVIFVRDTFGYSQYLNVSGGCVDVVFGSYCPAGSYLSRTGCKLCPVGFYSPNPGALFCQACPAGYGSCSFGSTSCQACPAGTTSVNGVCRPCPAGSYASFEGSPTCTPCQAGTYTNSSGGATYCSGCQAGYYSNAGAANCSTCVPGTYSTGYAEVCLACGAGTYSSYYASSFCYTCPSNTYSPARSAQCISCPPGQVSQPGSFACYDAKK